MELWQGRRSMTFILAAFPEYPIPLNWLSQVESRVFNLLGYVKTVSYGSAELNASVAGPYELEPREGYSDMQKATEAAIHAFEEEARMGENFVCVIFNQPGSGGFYCWDGYEAGYFFPGSKIYGAGYVLRDTSLGVFALDCLDSLARFEKIRTRG